MDRFSIISSDCHAGLPAERYKEYLDPKYHDMFDMALPLQTEATDKAEEILLLKEINDEWRAPIEDQLKGAWDYERRLEVLDGDGVAGEVIFPDGITEQNSPPFGAGLSMPTKDMVPELQWAGSRAHNRWLAELCANDPVRHFGLALCPILWDIDEAIKEVRWANENGLRGVMLPLMSVGFESYHHPKYDPFWEVCEDLGMVICFHSGPAPMEDYLGPMFPMGNNDNYPGAVGIFITEVFFWTYRPRGFYALGWCVRAFSKTQVQCHGNRSGFPVATIVEDAGSSLPRHAFLRQAWQLPGTPVYVSNRLFPP